MHVYVCTLAYRYADGRCVVILRHIGGQENTPAHTVADICLLCCVRQGKRDTALLMGQTDIFRAVVVFTRVCMI
jgi:hypothetical protein